MYEIHGTLFFLFFFKNGRKNRECLWQILEIRKRKRFFVREGQRMEKERVETVQREGNRISEEKKKGRKKRKTELENFCNNRRIVTGFVLYSEHRDPVFCTEILRE